MKEAYQIGKRSPSSAEPPARLSQAVLSLKTAARVDCCRSGAGSHPVAKRDSPLVAGRGGPAAHRTAVRQGAELDARFRPGRSPSLCAQGFHCSAGSQSLLVFGR
jgi:hypothetical protein